jgi:hypothetical protein
MLPSRSVALTTPHPFQKKLTLTSPKSGGRSVCIVHSRTKATGFVYDTDWIDRRQKFVHQLGAWHLLKKDYAFLS